MWESQNPPAHPAPTSPPSVIISYEKYFNEYLTFLFTSFREMKITTFQASHYISDLFKWTFTNCCITYNLTGKNWLMRMVHNIHVRPGSPLLPSSVLSSETGVENGRPEHYIVLLHTSVLTIANVCAPHLGVQSPSPPWPRLPGDQQLTLAWPLVHTTTAITRYYYLITF